jgi:DnaJ-class molecular chaperone
MVRTPTTLHVTVKTKGIHRVFGYLMRMFWLHPKIHSNNEEEVREEWEKIQMAYKILIDSKTRKRYDRSEVIADPGAAMRRAAVGATINGVTSIGKGLFSLGQMAAESLSNTNNDKEKNGIDAS